MPDAVGIRIDSQTPAHGEGVKLAGIHPVHRGAELHEHQIHLDAQILHVLLEEQRHLLSLPAAFRHQELEFQPHAILLQNAISTRRPTSIGQDLSSQFRVVLVIVHPFRCVSPGCGGHGSVGHDAEAFQNHVHVGLPVEPVGDGLADSGIRESLLPHVEADIVVAQGFVNVHIDAGHGLNLLILLGGDFNVVHPVLLQVNGNGVLGHLLVDQGVDIGAPEEVVIIGFQNHVLICHKLHKLEGAAADGIEVKSSLLQLPTGISSSRCDGRMP